MAGVDIIKGPVGQIIGLIIWTVVFSLIIGAINGWYLQSKDAGSLSGERFDRIVLKADNGRHERRRQMGIGYGRSRRPNRYYDANFQVHQPTCWKRATRTPTTACQLRESAVDGCPKRVMTPIRLCRNDAYTPLGTKIEGSAHADSGKATVDGCKWSPAGEIFGSAGRCPA